MVEKKITPDAFWIEQYQMLNEELLAIHARSDRLEQFFIVTVGALYGFAFTKPHSFSGFILLVPSAICFFAFVRLELLSRVRGIINKKQIEIEQHFLEEGQLGKVEHFQKEFYDGGDRPTSPKIAWNQVFFRSVSDRAQFWRVAFFMSIFVTLITTVAHYYPLLLEVVGAFRE